MKELRKQRQNMQMENVFFLLFCCCFLFLCDEFDGTEMGVQAHNNQASMQAGADWSAETTDTFTWRLYSSISTLVIMILTITSLAEDKAVYCTCSQESCSYMLAALLQYVDDNDAN